MSSIQVSKPEVFKKTMKDFFFDSKLVRTDKDIHDAVKLWCSNRNNAIITYGHINIYMIFI
jgi:hypothetical protein